MSTNILQRRPLLMLCFCILLLSSSGAAQTQTVGLFLNDSRAQEGYTLFAPMGYSSTYLINNEGLLVHEWTSSARPGLSAYLTEEGHLLRTESMMTPIMNGGGAGGRIREWDWDGSLLWSWEYASNTYRQHHDIEPLPNGNVLVIAWESKTRQEALDAGRRSDLLGVNGLWPDHIIEVRPIPPSGAEIVWEWHAWDHLVQDVDTTKPNYGVVADHPERIHINYPDNPKAARNADWMHTNSIDYNPALDQILLSSREFNEVWVIDHSTTTAEAAGSTGGNSGRGGDLLYRWGNPAAYQTGSAQDRTLYFQHDARWIEEGKPGAGNILVFNNGEGRPGAEYSSVDEFSPPVDARGKYLKTSGQPFEPAAPQWTYASQNPTDMFARNISGAERQSNGNTLVCVGPFGELLEVTPQKETVWRYVSPVTQAGPVRQGTDIGGGVGGSDNQVFRASRYSPDYPGFIGRDLTPGDPIELDPLTHINDEMPLAGEVPQLSAIWPQPARERIGITMQLPREGDVTLVLSDMLGREIVRLIDAVRYAAGTRNATMRLPVLPVGSYVLQLRTGSGTSVRCMQILQ